jgi:hypothetical protein
VRWFLALLAEIVLGHCIHTSNSIFSLFCSFLLHIFCDFPPREILFLARLLADMLVLLAGLCGDLACLPVVEGLLLGTATFLGDCSLCVEL